MVPLNSSESTCSAQRTRLIRLAEAYGLRIADAAICRGHSAPAEFLESWVFDRPPLSLERFTIGSSTPPGRSESTPPGPPWEADYPTLPSPWKGEGSVPLRQGG